MEGNIQDTEPLARFIFSSSHFSRLNLRVKHNAFLPAANGTVSVFRTEAKSEGEVWEIGAAVANKRKQTLYARADLNAAEVRRHALDVTPEEPPPHHANIVGWSSDKDAQKLIAMELAEASRLVVTP